MAENLKTKKYRDGNPIPFVVDNATWVDFKNGLSCCFNNDLNKIPVYGMLYNYSAVKNNNICPLGWLVPDKEDITALLNYTGNNNCVMLRETTNNHWINYTGASNETGFTSLPAGYCSSGSDNIRIFGGLGYYDYFWTSTLYDHTDAILFNTSCPTYIYSLISKSAGLSVRCLMDSIGFAVNTANISSITSQQCIGGGEVHSLTGAAVLAKGVCWSTNQYPTINDAKTIDTSSTNIFVSTITGLTPNATYYVRAYATGNSGTKYGNTITFQNSPLNYPVVDIDGNFYDTVKIGNQIWMKQNLKVTHFTNGDNILLVNVNNSNENNIAAYSNYDWSTTISAVYGKLYNWYVIEDDRKVCPLGWHVPDDNEFAALSAYLGGDNVSGGKLKEVGTLHWYTPNNYASNESGFTALGAGGWNSTYGFNLKNSSRLCLGVCVGKFGIFAK
jgi:uncharacterized protein (TIGR02145 family)